MTQTEVAKLYNVIWRDLRPPVCDGWTVCPDCLLGYRMGCENSDGIATVKIKSRDFCETVVGLSVQR